jgi:shikimate kinase/3-dehydroquinate synthase
MGAGKTTVGRALGALSRHPFVDLDDLVEQRAGRSIPEIFREGGESEFRGLERQELETLLNDWPRQFEKAPILALGGGALLNRAARLSALGAATVVTLSASAQTLARRAAGAGRPLLGGPDPERRVAELLEQRRLAYAEAHACADTDALDVQGAARRIYELWTRDLIAVAAGERSYTVEIGAGILAKRLPELVEGSTRVLLVTDRVVGPLHSQKVLTALEDPPVFLELEPGERHKNLAGLERIYHCAFEHHLDRKAAVIALGGGVVTDVAGFFAASWMRGLAWIGLPTTLLAMVDAAVGGKTAVDFRSAKNAIGAFWQPKAVLCDVVLLRTEPARGYVGALAEVVKSALIGDASLLDLLEKNLDGVRQRDPVLVREMVRRCIQVKATIVGLDEREGGVRSHLNLGHTLGHALESEGGYARLSHGEAVSLGLVVALNVGEKLAITKPELRRRVVALLGALGLPTNLAEQPIERAAALVGHDKKRAGSRVGFVLVREAGSPLTHPLELDELRRLVSEPPV